MLAELFFGIFFNLSVWYKLTDRTVWGMWFSLMGLATTVILNIVLVPHISYMGCAVAALCSYGFCRDAQLGKPGHAVARRNCAHSRRTAHRVDYARHVVPHRRVPPRRHMHALHRHSGCGCCPELSSIRSRDWLSRSTWSRKVEAYRRRHIHFVAVSRWLRLMASESSLMRGQRVDVIPNAFPVDSFHIEPRRSRAELGLPEGKSLLS